MSFFSKQAVCALSLITFCFAWATQNAWADLEDLPFIGSKFPFEIKFTDTPKFASRLTDVVNEQRKQSMEFDAITSMRGAARFDRDVIAKWLESEGYFSHRIQSDTSGDEIVHTITSGPAYIVQSIRYNFPADVKVPDTSKLPLQKGKRLRAEDVLDNQQQIRSDIHESDCLYQVQLDYTAEINRQSHQAFVEFTLRDSPRVKFGKSSISGEKEVRAHYLLWFLTYKEGECFNRKAVETSRLALLQSNLLARVEPQIQKPAGGEVNINYEVTERSPRTIKAGIGYDTATEVGYLLGWEHRNLFHGGEKLDIELQSNKVIDSLDSQLIKQHFLRKDQTLAIKGKIYEETTDGYVYTAAEASTTIDRPLSRRWAANIGVAFEYARDLREDTDRNFALISTPIIFDFNRSNQLLNPTRGWSLSTQIQPFLDLNNTNIQFTKASVRISAYLSAQKLPGKPVLALRWGAGDISGEDIDRVPSKHRYYVGGGGSVRGYGYQMAGELEDTDEKQNVPKGGLSFSEASMELRLRHSKNWGSAIFLDGGFAYEGDRLSFGEDYLWGAGVGVRFFTSFAPIRFDIATPLDTRYDADGTRIDDPIQIYIGIGQAF